MEKIKLNRTETRNLTRIKIDDVKQLIHDAQFVLDALYYDKSIAYMPGVRANAMVNPVEDIYSLIESIEFMHHKFYKNEWERENEFNTMENMDLANVLDGLRQSLHNSIQHAASNSQFKDQYKNWLEAYHKNRDANPFHYAKDKLENKIEEEAGWVPTYNNGKVSYSYWTEYNGKLTSLADIERDDEKQILTPEIVKERISRGY